MPTQGRNYGGTTGARYALYIDWYEDSLDEFNNTSRVVGTIRMYTSNNYGWYDGTSPGGGLYIHDASWGIDGNYADVPNGFVGNMAVWGTWATYVTHNDDGNKQINLRARHGTSQSYGGQTLYGPDFTDLVTLSSLYQEIGFDVISFPNITDVGFQVYCTVNRTANLLDLNINGAGWVNYYSGNFTSVTVNVGGTSAPMASGVAHSVQLRVRRYSVTAHYGYSGVYYPTTLRQNNFFDLTDF